MVALWDLKTVKKLSNAVAAFKPAILSSTVSYTTNRAKAICINDLLIFTCAFCTLMSMDRWFCKLLKIHSVTFKDKAFILASPVSIDAATTELSACQKVQTNRQTDSL